MLTELKDKSQVTIPKAIVNELGLKRGDESAPFSLTGLMPRLSGSPSRIFSRTRLG